MVEWCSDPTALPLVGAATGRYSGDQLREWLLINKEDIQQRLHARGAILFRGFDISSPAHFQEIASIFCNDFSDYVGGNSPRTRVSSHVFTSTEYPKEERISMHNEASYLLCMPRTILFCCLQPASTGGQTPLADCRRVLSRIDQRVRDRFDRAGIRYVNNLHGGVGLGRSWKQAYGTDDRGEVERQLKANGGAFEWRRNGSLRTSMLAPATARHPATDEKVWINQAEQWHSSSLDPALLEDLRWILSEDELPHNAYLGDGSPLNADDLADVRKAMAAEERIFDWQKGDVLLCDNCLVMHGRQPFTGNRKVVVAMG
jgi:hypothetical protein